MRFPARAPLLTLLLTLLALPAPPAAAQMWPNETGPGGDLLGNSGRQFDRIRPVEPARPATATGLPPLTLPGQQPAMAPAWTPPPLPREEATRATTTRRRAVRRAAPRRLTDEQWQRSFTRREQEIERLRQRLDDDRQRYDSQRAGTALRSTPQPASPAITQ
ncbi:hypothetical protein NON00_05540 [Roseomonas sp. GC11]|uniref:hypothetical protein n=1 Tax=Roseomonas sp. GC11 TaxID=2950546 RepID=UPI00210DBF2E|nr:hypothetical protein [Roseomonas sp. GC11]MCQ4159384.1 hypothetical protein [Roseomonas sp. GC11]